MSDKTKRDLEIEIENLADAVEQKDLEINKIKTSFEKEMKEIKKIHEENLSKLKENQKKELQNHFKTTEENLGKDYQQVKDQNIKLSKALSFYTKALDKVISNHGSLLKTLQGTVDAHVELNEYIYEEIFPEKKNKGE